MDDMKWQPDRKMEEERHEMKWRKQIKGIKWISLVSNKNELHTATE